MFTTYPSYPPYRALKLQSPRLVGEDVYALQTMLNALGPDVITDGVLGPATSAAVLAAQRAIGLDADGKVGPLTWTVAVHKLAVRTRSKYHLPEGLPWGSLAHESGPRGGMYSSPPRSNGSYDAGVAQRNTQFTPPREGFDVPKSIDVLGLQTRVYYEVYSGVPARRRWGLAAGAWNAWAYANYIANEEGARVDPKLCRNPDRDGALARSTFEAYIASVTVDLVV